jgi:PAS domain S-box-containing protein
VSQSHWNAATPVGRDTFDAGAATGHQAAGGIAHETGDLHRLLVESVDDYAIFALDQEGYILSWNAGAQRFKGYTAAEVIGKHFSIFYPREKIDEGFPEFELREAARVGRFEDEGWRIRKDGSRFCANVVITALRDAAGARPVQIRGAREFRGPLTAEARWKRTALPVSFRVSGLRHLHARHYRTHHDVERRGSAHQGPHE